MAATSDPTLAEFYELTCRQRYFGAGRVVARLVEIDGLRPEVSAENATDQLYALAGADVYLLLTRDRGWTPEAYQPWLTSQLASALLPLSGPPRNKRSA